MAKKLTKVFVLSVIGMLLFSCEKKVDTAIETEQPTPFNNRETINKMVEITKQQTAKLKQKIEELTARNIRMTNLQYEDFVRNNIQEYSAALIEAEPTYIENNNFQINQIDTENWDSGPDVYAGDAVSALPNTLLTRFDAVADQLEAVDNDPIYDNEFNLTNGGIAMESILQNEINSINNDGTLSVVDKQGLTDAFQAAKDLIQPEMAYFRTLAEGAQALNQDLTTWRARTFFGKLIRAVARVAIAVVAVAVVTAVIVKAAPLIAAGGKFAAKIAAKGATKSILFGVGKKVATTNVLGLTTTITGGLVMPELCILAESPAW